MNPWPPRGLILILCAVLPLAACSSDPSEKDSSQATATPSQESRAPEAGTPASQPEGVGAGESASVSFTRDIAPIVFKSCAPCHRDGESAPFPLLTYEDVQQRAAQIAVVTESRFMPPWLPDPDTNQFEGERRLSDTELGLIRRWVREGAVKGDPADLPEPPTWTEGWQLGEPDLVVAMEDVYTLGPEGFDVFRNFIIPVEVDEPRYIKAVEIRPGNKRVVHHAILQVDPWRASRELDALDEELGFGGMEMGSAHAPDGQFLGWTPGKLPHPGDDAMSWRLAPGTDLVLQLHMLPSGRPEPIQPTIGFFYAETPPTEMPTVLVLENQLIDIPAGEAHYELRDELVLPVDVEATAIYPHAHYIGKKLHGYGVLPDGTRRWLIRIDDWDFNWQDDYRFVEPVFLPAGTTLTMDYIYDNSAENLRNPFDPPRRVGGGNRSTDEMGSLMVLVMVRDPDKQLLLDEAQWAAKVAKYPTDAIAHKNLSGVLRRKGDFVGAERQLRQAVSIQENYAEANLDLGNILAAKGDVDGSIACYRRLLAARPDYAVGHNNLGRALQQKGDLAGAKASYQRALALDDRLAMPHGSLALMLQREGNVDAALEHFEAAAELKPDWPVGLSGAAWILATHPDPRRRDPQRALRYAERANEITGGKHPMVLDALASAQAANGDYSTAAETADRAARAAARNPTLAAQMRQRAALYRQGQPYVEPQ